MRLKKDVLKEFRTSFLVLVNLNQIKNALPLSIITSFGFFLKL